MMKRSNLLWGACFCTLPLSALPARHGNEIPSTGEERINTRCGFYGHYIFNAYFKVDKDDSVVRDTTIMTSAGEFTLNFFNRVDAYAALGSSKIDIKTTLTTLHAGGAFRNSDLLIDLNSALWWSCGINGQLFHIKNFYFGTGVQYADSRPTINYVQDDFHAVSHYFDDFKTHYYVWGLSLGGHLDFPLSESFIFRPNGSMGYGITRLNMKSVLVPLEGNTTIEISNMFSPYLWGYSVGFTLIGGSRLSLSTDISFISQVAAFIHGSLLF